jgi:hypothetical protein
MALFKFGSSIKPQRFNYIPRYYDPEKEDREERIRQAMGMASTDPDAIKARITKSFRDKQRSRQKSPKGAARRSNIILIVTLITLIMLTYILLSRYMPAIERWLE